MKLTEAEGLQPHDEVHWTDPDNGECSRTLKIQSIDIKGVVVVITDTDGITLECFAEELS